MLENEELRTVVLRTKNLLIEILKVTQKLSEAESLYNLYKKCIELLLSHSIYDMQSMFMMSKKSSGAFTFTNKKDILQGGIWGSSNLVNCRSIYPKICTNSYFQP